MKIASDNPKKEEILQFLQAQTKVIRSFEVRNLGLFGSIVRNEQHQGSDMDFLVEYEPGQKCLKNYFGLMD